ncbi:MAG: tandem-95 repeat protein, partial [Candidatus Magnetomorum sp.]|nr:tandem-95 repeat protein [Candidatus Magnetomorum sp.]
KDTLEVQWGQPAHGSVSGNSSQLVYTPYPSYSGLDAFWVEAFDGYVQSRVMVQILVGKVNQAPEAKNRTIETLEDMLVEITLPAVDPDYDTLSYTIVQGPTHGTITGTPPSVIYQPDKNFHGQDTIEFMAHDGIYSSNIGQITLIIAPQNDTPVAIDTRLDTHEDTRVNGLLLASDVDQEPLTFQWIQNGQKGQAQLIDGTTGAFTYTPYSDVYGTDVLVFQAFDTMAQSNPGYVTLTIIPVNDAPIGFAANWETDEDIPLEATLTAQDPDSSALTFSIVDPPKIGSLLIVNSSAGFIRYTPFANAYGQDQFTYRVSDLEDTAAPVQVIIDVHSVNDPPTAQSFDIQFYEDTDYSGTLKGSDVDTAIVTYEIVTAPQKGEIEWTDAVNGQFVYKPVSNIFGTDLFTYQVSDGMETSEMASVSVWITPVNDVPVLVSKDIEINENQVGHATLMAQDADNDPLIFHLISLPENGTASIDGAGLTYTPNNRYIGVDTIQVQADDGFSQSKTASIQFWVGIHQADIIATEDEPIRFELPDGAVINDAPASGNIEKSGNDYIYTPHPNTFGDDSFSYTIDGTRMTRTIFIKPVNDSPVFNASTTLTIIEDQIGIMAANVSDPDTVPDQWVASVIDAPQHGSLKWDGQQIEYRPFSDYNGEDMFTIRISDGFENSFDTLSVQVTITPQNDAPRPNGQTVSLVEDTYINIHLTATDIEQDAITFSVSKLPSNGKLTGSGADLMYTPNPDYFGTDRFWFTANDMSSSSQAIPVTILVIGSYDAPRASDSILNVPDAEPVFGQLSAYDPDGDFLIYIIITQSSKGLVVITDASKGTYSFTPYPGASGEDFFTFKVNDTQQSSNLGFVSVNISSTQVDYHLLTLSLEGDYLQGDPYTYTLVNTTTGTVVKQDQSTDSEMSMQLPENTYAFYFSGKDYQPYAETFELTADMNAPVTIENTPGFFRMSIALQGDYVAGDDIIVNILDANTLNLLKRIESTNTPIGARLIAGVYAFTIQAVNYEPYSSSQVYLDKDRVINTPLIQKISGAGQLIVDLKGDYQEPDAYRYIVINAKTGNIVKDDQAQEQPLTIPLNAGNYRLMIIARNYDPLECHYMGQNIITLNPSVHIQAELTQSAFNPEPAIVHTSHMQTDDGLSIKFIPENFTEGLTVTLNEKTIVSNTSHTFTYNWKTAIPVVQPLENTPENGDRRYVLDFQFFDGSQLVGNYQTDVTEYASEASQAKDRPQDQQTFESRYGEAASIAQASGLFYPLIGTSLPVTIKNTDESIQTFQIDVPPLPLDYLFIDNSSSTTSGLLMYRSEIDTYQTNTASNAHPKPEDQLKIIVRHYRFDQNAGSGVSVSFQMVEGTYAGASVRYNPILNNQRFSDKNQEIPPAITVPLILNPLSPAYASLSNDLDHSSIANVRINERGDKTNGLRLASVPFTRVQNLVNFKMTHLTSIGFDTEKYVEPVQPQPESGDSGGGCFIGVILGW